MSDTKKELLGQIGFIISARDTKWQENYNLAKRYYEKHNNLLIPHNFKTINGYEYDESGINLGNWINTQRSNYNTLPKEKKQLLEQIGFIISANDTKWQENYNLAKVYYEKYNNLLIPRKFKTINGFEYDESGINLGKWINTQRKNYDALSDAKKELLEQIGFILKVYDTKWQENYNFAKAYYEKYSNLLIPSDFKTTNGFEYDKLDVNAVKLGFWISNQRKNYNTLSKEKKQLLGQIGFIISANDTKWQENYNLAKVYYEKHNNLLIPHNFKTINGYEYDETGVKLGVWIATQRTNYNTLSDERKQLLDQIGMVWDTKKNTNQIKDICISNGINMDINKLVISHISIQQFKSIIEFLKNQNIPITDNNGVLHEIFRMSSYAIKENYGITLEELINKYYTNNSKGKGI